MNYLVLKYFHLVCVALSFSLLFVRGWWIARLYPPPSEPWIRQLPRWVDALLLVSALGLVAAGPRLEWPAWLQMKIVLVGVYAALALLALRAMNTRLQNLLIWAAALLIFVYITMVAVLQHPLGVFSLL